MFYRWFLGVPTVLISLFLALCPPASYGFDPLKFNPRAIEINENLLFPADAPIGSLDAPVTVVDYSSFSCTHCKAAFEKLIVPLYESYVKEGKVILIMRDFPLDNLSFNASVFLVCYRKVKAVDESHVISMITKLFDVGSRAKSKEEVDVLLNQIISDANLPADEKTKLLSCMDSLEIKDEILYSKLFGIKQLGLTGTPMLYINGERYTGAFKFSSFVDKIEKALAVNRSID